MKLDTYVPSHPREVGVADERNRTTDNLYIAITKHDIKIPQLEQKIAITRETY